METPAISRYPPHAALEQAMIRMLEAMKKRQLLLADFEIIKTARPNAHQRSKYIPMLVDQSNQLLTERLLLKRPCREDANQLLVFRLENRDHLRPWEPARDDFFYTLQATENQLGTMLMQMEAGIAQYWILQSLTSAKMLGECSFTNIVRGSFQACYLGFSIAREFEGMGLMHEALQTAISDIFANHGLHRIMANFQPSNSRSEKLLSRLGFQQEGLALKYLKINGKWMDHILTSKINSAEL